jgi:hypothetical protein
MIISNGSSLYVGMGKYPYRRGSKNRISKRARPRDPHRTAHAASSPSPVEDINNVLRTPPRSLVARASLSAALQSSWRDQLIPGARSSARVRGVSPIKSSPRARSSAGSKKVIARLSNSNVNLKKDLKRANNKIAQERSRSKKEKTSKSSKLSLLDALPQAASTVPQSDKRIAEKVENVCSVLEAILKHQGVDVAGLSQHALFADVIKALFIEARANQEFEKTTRNLAGSLAAAADDDMHDDAPIDAAVADENERCIRWPWAHYNWFVQDHKRSKFLWEDEKEGKRTVSQLIFKKKRMEKKKKKKKRLDW